MAFKFDAVSTTPFEIPSQRMRFIMANPPLPVLQVMSSLQVIL